MKNTSESSPTGALSSVIAPFLLSLDSDRTKLFCTASFAWGISSFKPFVYLTGADRKGILLFPVSQTGQKYNVNDVLHRLLLSRKDADVPMSPQIETH